MIIFIVMNLNEQITRIKSMMGLIKEDDNINIRKIQETDKGDIMELVVDSFKHLMDPKEIPPYIDAITNYDKSIVAEQNGEIIGVYLLGDRKMSKAIKSNKCDEIYVDLDEYDNLIGLEGVALITKESTRGTGVGSLLKDYVKNLGADYIWGLQYKGLNNLEHWLRRRRLAAENEELNVTVEDL